MSWFGRRVLHASRKQSASVLLLSSDSPPTPFAMSDVEMHTEPQSLFFAGSDDEDKIVSSHPTAEVSSSSALPNPITLPPEQTRSPPRTALFFPDSDDEIDIPSPPNKRRRIGNQTKHHSEAGTPDFEEIPRASSVSSVSDHLSIRSVSPPVEPSVVNISTSKKRPRSPEHAPPQRTYIGEVLVPNAWSNVSGKNYIKVNDAVQVKRDEQDDLQPAALSRNLTSKKQTGKKQLSLKAMLPSRPGKLTTRKKKVDNIIRLYNTRGFGKITNYLGITSADNFA